VKGNKRTNKNDGKVLSKKERTKINRQKERRNGKDKLFFLSSLDRSCASNVTACTIHQILIG
jgi:hypothetical protein